MDSRNGSRSAHHDQPDMDAFIRPNSQTDSKLNSAPQIQVRFVEFQLVHPKKPRSDYSKLIPNFNLVEPEYHATLFRGLQDVSGRGIHQLFLNSL